VTILTVNDHYLPFVINNAAIGSFSVRTENLAEVITTTPLGAVANLTQSINVTIEDTRAITGTLNAALTTGVAAEALTVADITRTNYVAPTSTFNKAITGLL